MPEFMLEPDQIDTDSPERSRAPREVSSGLAPTADVPTKKHKKEPAPCYVPCEACGQLVLMGDTADGRRLAVDLEIPMYVIGWNARAERPCLYESRGHAVHHCGGMAREGGLPGVGATTAQE
jgi:hypothetical protein